MGIVFYGILGYVVLQLLVGAFLSRRMKSESDYVLAGRSLGYFVATMSIFATWFGAETCIGSAGAIYEEGLSGGRADPFGYTLCIALMGLVFAVPLWRRQLTTLGDLFRARYGRGVETFAVMMMIPTSMMWAAAQIRAFGQVLSASSNIEVSLCITIAAVVVIAYTTMGGLLADAYTDVIQGVVLVGGLIVLLVAIVMNPPESAALSGALTPERLNPLHGDSILETLEGWAIPIIGSLFAQELVARTLASRSPQVARYSALMASGVYVAVGLIPVVFGLLGPAITPGLDDPEQLLPAMAGQYLPPLLYMVFAGALVSAILSTVDSTLLASAALFSHNIVVPLIPGATERTKVRAARVLVVLFGLSAYVLAQYAEGVYALVEQASAFGSAGLFVGVLFAFLPRFGGRLSGYACLVAGVVGYAIFEYVLEWPCPFLLSLAASFGGYAAMSVFDSAEEPSLQETSEACK